MRRPELRLESEVVWTPGVNPRVGAFAAGPAPGGAGAHPGQVPNEPFTAEVRGSAGSAAYRAHMYHTKVPPEAIEPYIEYYTAPGAMVLDPFCGSGMTGVAALRRGRRALLVDLSPFAAFLAYNHCAHVEPEELRSALRAVLDKVRPALEPMYRVDCPGCGAPATLRYVVWSDVFRCPACREHYVLWDAAVDNVRRVHSEFRCPHCRRAITKRLDDRVGSRPVAMEIKCPNGCDGHEVPADNTGAGDASPITHDARVWWPADAVPDGLDELSRVRRSGVETVADLFTQRNLEAVARLWAAASEVEPARLRARALFAVTAIMVRASRLIKYIPSRRMAPGPILGTMYLPSLSAEISVLELFERRIRSVCRAAAEMPPGSADDLCISTQSATDLGAVPDASIDYVFTDPPFGRNIMYSELNFLWECWLGWRTDPRQEAVVSRSQSKAVAQYGRLMAAAFAEIRRVLRPGRWMTLVFHNTQAAVWAEIQSGVENAGFSIESVQTLDKPRETFKQVTAEGAVGHDVVVHCRNAATFRRCGRAGDPAAALGKLIDGAPEGPCKERTPRHLHARLIGDMMVSGAVMTLDYQDVLRLLEQHFEHRNGYWFQRS